MLGLRSSLRCRRRLLGRGEARRREGSGQGSLRVRVRVRVQVQVRGLRTPLRYCRLRASMHRRCTHPPGAPAPHRAAPRGLCARSTVLRWSFGSLLARPTPALPARRSHIPAFPSPAVARPRASRRAVLTHRRASASWTVSALGGAASASHNPEASTVIYRLPLRRAISGSVRARARASLLPARRSRASFSSSSSSAPCPALPCLADLT